jgi:hypothetical protein
VTEESKNGVARVERWDEDTVVVKIGDFPLCLYPRELAKDCAQIYADAINAAISQTNVPRSDHEELKRRYAELKKQSDKMEIELLDRKAW